MGTYLFIALNASTTLVGTFHILGALQHQIVTVDAQDAVRQDTWKCLLCIYFILHRKNVCHTIYIIIYSINTFIINRHNVENYKPISKLSPDDKLFEKIM